MAYHLVLKPHNTHLSSWRVNVRCLSRAIVLSALASAFIASAFAAPAFAAPKPNKPALPPTPKALVQSFYDNYAPGKTPPDVLETLVANGTASFGKLIASEQACITKTKQICKLDYDVIINGQEYETVKFIDSEVTKTKNGMMVCANFENIGNKQRVCYQFMQETAKVAGNKKATPSWRIDDVINYSDGKAFSVRKILSDK